MLLLLLLLISKGEFDVASRFELYLGFILRQEEAQYFQGGHLLPQREEASNRPFPSSKSSHFQNKTSAKPYMYFSLRIKNPFHINSLALSLALKQRLGATQKWPICISPVTAYSIFVL